MCVQERIILQWWRWRRSCTPGLWVLKGDIWCTYCGRSSSQKKFPQTLRMSKVGPKWWGSWDMGIRPPIDSRSGWRSSRGRPSGRWRVERTLLPVWLVSEKKQPSVKKNLPTNVFFFVVFLQMKTRCTCSGQTMTVASGLRVSWGRRFWSQFYWSFLRGDLFSWFRVETTMWWCWPGIRTSTHGAAENTVHLTAALNFSVAGFIRFSHQMATASQC